jgi:hypothetical protein
VTLDEAVGVGETDHDKIEVLEMVYDQGAQKLSVLVKVEKNTLKSIGIEL